MIALLVATNVFWIGLAAWFAFKCMIASRMGTVTWWLIMFNTATHERLEGIIGNRWIAKGILKSMQREGMLVVRVLDDDAVYTRNKRRLG